MSPRTNRLWVAFGLQVRDARLLRRWSVTELAHRAGVSAGMVYRVEAGQVASTDMAMRIASALGRRAELELVDQRRRVETRANLAADPVHSAMGEFEARHLRACGNAIGIGIDEPYQHFQFAGRADVVAWQLEQRALLHIENRTRFPDMQEMAGAFNAKRAYLAESIGERLGVASWVSETHVIAALWSAEVLHAIRLRPDTFRSICPDSADAFDDWWRGGEPSRGRRSALIVIDPLATGRQRPFLGLEQAMTARPRHRGYAEVVRRMLGQAA